GDCGSGIRGRRVRLALGGRSGLAGPRGDPEAGACRGLDPASRPIPPGRDDDGLPLAPAHRPAPAAAPPGGPARPAGGTPLAFVQDPLSDLAFAVLAPLPAVAADRLVEVLLGDADRPEPDPGLVVAHLVELRAAGEVEEIGAGPGAPALAFGVRDRSVE